MVFELWAEQKEMKKKIAAAPPRVLLLPPPGKGRSATLGGLEISLEALAAREWMATKGKE